MASIFSRRIGPLTLYVIIIFLGLSIGLPLIFFARRPPDIPTLCQTEVPEQGWKYIVLHHSATKEGSAASFDRYHKEVRGWSHGLGYHFVIGNGTQSGDGEIEVGERWKKQLQGAHAGDAHYNSLGIGICLVGNFEEGKRPSRKQFKSLVRITHYLCNRYNIPLTGILMHRQILENHTACPGKNFPYGRLIHELEKLTPRDIARKSSEEGTDEV